MLVATDGREQSDAAVRAGLLLAGDSDAWWVLTVPSPFPMIAPELDLQLAAEAAAIQRETHVEAVRAQVRRIVGGRNVRVEALDGDPADVIGREAARANASLIVAGLGRHKLIDRLLAGETILRLIRSASSTPVLAIGPEFSYAKTVIAGLDFSENSVHAARLALRFVDRGATVYLMHVTPPNDVLGLLAGGPAAYHEQAMSKMSELIAEFELPPGVHVQPVVRQGDAARCILDYASETQAGLIAIGTRGQGLLARLVVGSVATKVIRGSPVAVLTVPP
jgi:nucleotide-binding universal stress UspA family protein